MIWLIHWKNINVKVCVHEVNQQSFRRLSMGVAQGESRSLRT